MAKYCSYPKSIGSVAHKPTFIQEIKLQKLEFKLFPVKTIIHRYLRLSLIRVTLGRKAELTLRVLSLVETHFFYPKRTTS